MCRLSVTYACIVTKQLKRGSSGFHEFKLICKNASLYVIYKQLDLNIYIYFYAKFTPPTLTIRDCLVLSCRVDDVSRTGDKSRLFSVVLNILETEQFCPVLSAV